MARRDGVGVDRTGLQPDDAAPARGRVRRDRERRHAGAAAPRAARRRTRDGNSIDGPAPEIAGTRAGRRASTSRACARRSRASCTSRAAPAGARACRACAWRARPAPRRWSASSTPRTSTRTRSRSSHRDHAWFVGLRAGGGARDRGGGARRARRPRRLGGGADRAEGAGAVLREAPAVPSAPAQVAGSAAEPRAAVAEAARSSREGGPCWGLTAARSRTSTGRCSRWSLLLGDARAREPLLRHLRRRRALGRDAPPARCRSGSARAVAAGLHRDRLSPLRALRAAGLRDRARAARAHAGDRAE